MSWSGGITAASAAGASTTFRSDTSDTFAYTKGIFTAPKAGLYRFELYGSKGKDASSGGTWGEEWWSNADGGRGGYVSYYLEMNAGQTVSDAAAGEAAPTRPKRSRVPALTRWRALRKATSTRSRGAAETAAGGATATTETAITALMAQAESAAVPQAEMAMPRVLTKAVRAARRPVPAPLTDGIKEAMAPAHSPLAPVRAVTALRAAQAATDGMEVYTWEQCMHWLM